MEKTIEEWERCKASPAYFYHNYFIGVDGKRPERTMSDASFDRMCGAYHDALPEKTPTQGQLRGLYSHMWGALSDIRARKKKPFKYHVVNTDRVCKITITFPDCGFYVRHAGGPIEFNATGLSFSDCCKVVGYVPLPDIM